MTTTTAQLPPPIASARPGRITLHPAREQTTGEQRSAHLRHGVDTKTQLRERAECRICEKLFAPASIVIEDEYQHIEPGGGGIIDCAIFCDHCGVITRYTIRVDENMQSTELLKCSATSDERKIDAFLRTYPWARGIAE